MKHAETATTDALNALLRGEIAACETYQQAMARGNGHQDTATLKRIHEEHVEAANLLRRHVRDEGGKPDQGSGAWGAFAKTVQGGANLLGDTAALKALKEGEEQGVSSYESALKDASLHEDCRELIRSTLLPRTRTHVALLDHLMAAK